ncbi:hypothetical protein SSX86_014827 [Deinandra increscens subsp. villosa]|uniref:Uncharacterized protein n=1 Tax=Deinandra increscens subsp. villosa TaxID=3103831 RepID=A0AAP0H0P8_9ASTR
MSLENFSVLLVVTPSVAKQDLPREHMLPFFSQFSFEVFCCLSAKSYELHVASFSIGSFIIIAGIDHMHFSKREFCNMVKRIMICSSKDVKKMKAGSMLLFITDNEAVLNLNFIFLSRVCSVSCYSNQVSLLLAFYVGKVYILNTREKTNDYKRQGK